MAHSPALSCSCSLTLSSPLALAYLGVDMGEGKGIQSGNLEGHFDVNDPLLLPVWSQVLALF